MYPPIHKQPTIKYSYDRLDMLWSRYPQYQEQTTFTNLEALMEEHESYQKDLDEELKKEYLEKNYDRFLVQLSWADLAYRHATKGFIEDAAEDMDETDPEQLWHNPYVETFMDQFRDIDTDHKACFLFSESCVSQFFVILEVCKRAEEFRPIKNLFPDEEKVHFLAVFDKENIEDVMLMYHLLYTNGSQEVFGGYSLYDYSLPWYQNHLWVDGTVLRSPYLPDKLAKYQGNLPFYHNPTKTVYVRRNIDHMLECGYIQSELEFFLCLTRVMMPFFNWWYLDLTMYEEKDGIRTNWRMTRMQIRTDLTAEGVIKPKWKHELSLFHALRKKHKDTLYQYRPDWLGRQSLDLYIPSLHTGIEYQGIQHYKAVDFFGGEEALAERQDLDRQKKELCQANGVRLIEWPYSIEPTDKNLKTLLNAESDEDLASKIKEIEEAEKKKSRTRKKKTDVPGTSDLVVKNSLKEEE